jgi:hypothetical protein
VSTLSADVIAKATRLAEQGRVVPIGPAELIQVQGDHGTYAVVVGAEHTWCSCAARRNCSHIAAAVLLTLREQRDPPVRSARATADRDSRPRRPFLIQPIA